MLEGMQTNHENKKDMIRAKCNYKGSYRNVLCDWCPVEETTKQYLNCKSLGFESIWRGSKEGLSMNKLGQAALYVTWTEERLKDNREKGITLF